MNSEKYYVVKPGFKRYVQRYTKMNQTQIWLTNSINMYLTYNVKISLLNDTDFQP